MTYHGSEEPRPQRGPRCPFCGSVETELFSLFGQQLLTAQYYCHSCHTPFEHIKGDDVLEDARAKLSSPVRKEGLA
jgi:hypothetical protein